MLFYTLSSSNITYVIKNKFKNNYSILYGITGMILALDKSNNSSLEKILNIK